MTDAIYGPVTSNHAACPMSDVQTKVAGQEQDAVPVPTPGSLTAEFMKLLHHNNTLATPALKLLDSYFCLWECYIVKSAEKIRLEDEQRQLQGLNEWIASDSDTLPQFCDEVLCNGIVSALQASDPKAFIVNGP